MHLSTHVWTTRPSFSFDECGKGKQLPFNSVEKKTKSSVPYQKRHIQNPTPHHSSSEEWLSTYFIFSLVFQHQTYTREKIMMTGVPCVVHFFNRFRFFFASCSNCLKIWIHKMFKINYLNILLPFPLIVCDFKLKFPEFDLLHHGKQLRIFFMNWPLWLWSVGGL